MTTLQERFKVPEMLRRLLRDAPKVISDPTHHDDVADVCVRAADALDAAERRIRELEVRAERLEAIAQDERAASFRLRQEVEQVERVQERLQEAARKFRGPVTITTRTGWPPIGLLEDDIWHWKERAEQAERELAEAARKTCKVCGGSGRVHSHNDLCECLDFPWLLRRRNKELAEARAREQRLREALNDVELSDGAFRALCDSYLNPVPVVTADDQKWAAEALRPIGGELGGGER